MIKNKKNILTFLLPVILLAVFILPSLLQAADTLPNPPPNTITNPPASGPIIIKPPFTCGGQKECGVVELINKIINDILIPIGSVIAVLMIMYAGFLFVTARGNTTQIDKAKQALLYALIGAALLLGAKVISEAIKGTVDQLK
jgi:hypothetical protein